MRHQLFNVDTALITQRCVVRRFREGDGKAFYQLVDGNRDYILDSFPVLVAEAGKTKKGAEIFVREALADWILQNRYAFAVWHNETTELVGYVAIQHLNWQVPMGELNYFIDRELVQQGIMTEVLARVVRFAFKQIELEKLTAKILSDNYSSQRLARRVGFSREGDLRNEYRLPAGQLVDLIQFGFARETYGE